MTPVQVGTVRIDCCGTCDGIWFDAGKVEAYFRSKFPERLTDIPRDAHIRVHNSREPDVCPKCGDRQLCVGTLKLAAFRTCRSCHGVFLRSSGLHRLADEETLPTGLFDITGDYPIDVVLETVIGGPQMALMLRIARRIDDTVREEVP